MSTQVSAPTAPADVELVTAGATLSVGESSPEAPTKLSPSSDTTPPKKSSDAEHTGALSKLPEAGPAKGFFSKYFNYGFFLEHKSSKRPNNSTTRFFDSLGPRGTKFYDVVVWQRPRWVAFVLPIIIGWTWYLIFMAGVAENKLWGFYAENHKATSFVTKGSVTERWKMFITMYFGSVVAGGTSEGGASIAFPVMTLLMGIHPAIARDFSIMIQAYGMSASCTSIFYFKTKIEQHAFVWASVGGAIGVCFGLAVVAPALTPPQTKMFFVSAWLSFAVALFLINRNHGRQTFVQIPNFRWWKGLILGVFGFVGGTMTAIAGSGLDICTFACLTLLFRVSEKIATPTSVQLMAVNSIVAFIFKGFFLGGMEPDAWPFLIVCIPIVCVGSPTGAWLASFVHRLVLAGCVYVTDTAQFLAALAIVPQSSETHVITVVTFLSASTLWGVLAFVGEKVLAGEKSQPALKARQDKLTERAENAQATVVVPGLTAVPTAQADVKDVESQSPVDPVEVDENGDALPPVNSGLPRKWHMRFSHPAVVLTYLWFLPFVLLVLWQTRGWGINSGVPKPNVAYCKKHPLETDTPKCKQFAIEKAYCKTNYCGWGIGWQGCQEEDTAFRTANCYHS